MSKLPKVLVPVVAASLLAACAAPVSQQAVASHTDEARSIAARVPANLLAVLVAELQRSGPAGAIEVCRDKAPEMARNASAQTGWDVRRASLRNRNPKGVPDAWERAALERFDASVAAGASPATLETWEVVSEGGQRWYRYAKALPTQPMCVQCHGTAGELGTGVPEKLRTLYPNDRATGYAPGQVRGGLFLKKPI